MDYLLDHDHVFNQIRVFIETLKSDYVSNLVKREQRAGNSEVTLMLFPEKMSALFPNHRHEFTRMANTQLSARGWQVRILPLAMPGYETYWIVNISW